MKPNKFRMLPHFTRLYFLGSRDYNQYYHIVEDLTVCSSTLWDLSLPREPCVLGNATLYRLTSLNRECLLNMTILGGQLCFSQKLLHKSWVKSPQTWSAGGCSCTARPQHAFYSSTYSLATALTGPVTLAYPPIPFSKRKASQSLKGNYCFK